MQSSPNEPNLSLIEKWNIKPNTTLLLSTVALLSFMVLGSTVLAVQYKIAQNPNPKIIAPTEVLGIKYDLYNSITTPNDANSNSAVIDQNDIMIETPAKSSPEQINPSPAQINLKNDLDPKETVETKKNDDKIQNENIEIKTLLPKVKPEPKVVEQSFRDLTIQDLNQILLSNKYENTSEANIGVSITGSIQADQYIQNKAQSRGYRLWPQADEVKLETVVNSIKLQPKAKEAFLKMQETAKTEGVIIGLTSGYRSQIEQNILFRSRYESLQMAELGGYYTPEEILNGDSDVLLNRILSVTAPPGHSRHHTGYTVDLSDLSPDNTTTVFNGSKAYKWMSNDNFKNARAFGFLPSYPKGGTDFGPEPEAWEFVWVGENAL